MVRFRFAKPERSMPAILPQGLSERALVRAVQYAKKDQGFSLFKITKDRGVH
jgi:hypothetical protein